MQEAEVGFHLRITHQSIRISPRVQYIFRTLTKTPDVKTWSDTDFSSEAANGSKPVCFGRAKTSLNIPSARPTRVSHCRRSHVQFEFAIAGRHQSVNTCVGSPLAEDALLLANTAFFASIQWVDPDLATFANAQPTSWSEARAISIAIDRRNCGLYCRHCRAAKKC